MFIVIMHFHLQKYIEEKVSPEEKLCCTKNAIEKGFTGDTTRLPTLTIGGKRISKRASSILKDDAFVRSLMIYFDMLAY